MSRTQKYRKISPDTYDVELDRVTVSDEMLKEETKDLRKFFLGCSGVFFLILAPLTFYYFRIGEMQGFSQFIDDHAFTSFLWVLFFVIFILGLFSRLRRPKIIIEQQKMGKLIITGDSMGNIILKTEDGAITPMTKEEALGIMAAADEVKVLDL